MERRAKRPTATLRLRIERCLGFKRAVNSGVLVAEVKRNEQEGITNVKITDTSEKIAEYLKTADLDEVFEKAFELQKLQELAPKTETKP